MATTRQMAGIGSWVQLAFPNEPSSQNSTDWVAWGLPRKIKKLVTDSNSAESTTPHRISWVGASWRPVRETRNTAAMAPSAPSTLPTESAQIPSEANAPNSSTAVAPTLAPEDTPSRNGSARALRTRACTTVPAVVSAAPTTAASSTRGSRICQTISSATVSLRMAGQVVDDHLPHRGRAQRDRPDRHPEGHRHHQEHRAADQHDRQGETVAPPDRVGRGALADSGLRGHRLVLLVDRRTSGSGSPAGRRTNRP